MKKTIAFLCAALLLACAGCGGMSAETEQISRTVTEGGAEAPAAEYAGTLFDTSYVHTIDVQLSAGEWDAFIAECENEEYIQVDLLIDGELVTGAAIRAKGNSSMQRSRTSGKYSFKIEFDHFGDTLYHGLDKLCLNNLTSDDSCMRDYLVYRAMDAFGVPSPLASYAFVTVDGEDWGFYLAVEAIEESFLERNFGPDHGAVYKPDNTGGGGGAMRGGGGGGSNWGDDIKLKYLDDDPASYPSLFGSAKTDISRRDQYRLIRSLKLLSEAQDLESALDIEEVLRYLAAQSFVCNGDSYIGSSVHNYYLYVDEGRMSMLPWDYNEGFGDFGSSGMASVANSPIDSPFGGDDASERPMAAWVFTDEAYTARYHELYQQFLDDICTSGWAAQLMETTRDLIVPYVERDPRSYCTVEDFLAAVADHIAFFEVRAASVQGQLDGTIPSTAEGQAADSSALVDTSALPGRGGSGGGGGGGMMMPGAASGGPSGSSREVSSASREASAEQQETNSAS